MTLESDVAAHHGTQALLDRIKAALAEAGADPEAPTLEDVKPVDEFHTGGMQATEALLSQLDLEPATRVLDIGSGIGGTARAVAALHGGQVTGIDLTPAFVETAEALSRLVGLVEGPKPGPLAFPVPWSTVAETSFVEPPATYRDAAGAAGFRVVAERDRTDLGLAFFEKVFERLKAEGPPPIGIHLLMGPTAREKLVN